MPTTESGVSVNNMEFTYMTWQSADYARIAATLYPFFSRHADRRYSDATLSGLARVPQMLTEANVDVLHQQAPIVVMGSMPYSYDEDTEVKVGGTTGLLILFPASNFKAVIAVHRDARRVGVGRTLWRNSAVRVPAANFWVHKRNFDGQRFLLSLGLFPTGMNMSGSIRYSSQEEDE